MAQLVAHHTGSVGVRGSSPLSSTGIYAGHSLRNTYESLAHKGETMTTAAIATYAYDQIDQARAELEAVSK
jgi:hypothetical protein